MTLMQLTVVAALLAAPLAFAQGPGPNGPPDLPIDAATRSAVVETLARELDTRYVDVPLGAALARGLRERGRAHAYDAVTSSAALAERLNAELDAASHHKHLLKSFIASEPDPRAKAHMQEELSKL